VSEYDASTYGERIASMFDAWSGQMPTADTVEFLAGVAAAGPVLELGVATGRIAIPLAERGLDVVGVEPSPAMLEQLHTKPGGDRVRTIEGSLLDVELTDRFTLVFAIGDTVFLLQSQEDQIRCFERVAGWLADGGALVVETIMPSVLFRRDPFLLVESVEPDEVRIHVGQIDAAQQLMSSAHVVLGGEGIRIYPIKGRFALLGELDLMARVGGLKLRERWGGWKHEPLTPRAMRQVSVYERA
jgi:SAM-dependent methyltransferase